MNIHQMESQQAVAASTCTKFTPRCESWRHEEDGLRPACCTEHQKDILFAVADLLTQHGIVHWIDFGTLLGAVRHQAFIPWDYDVDISFIVDDSASFTFLEKIISAAGYNVTHCNPGSPDELKVRYSDINHNHLDLYGYHRSKDGILRMEWGDNPEEWFFPESFLDTLEPVTLYGRPFLVPSPLHDFLSDYRYGPSYQTPVRPFYALLTTFTRAELTPLMMEFFADLPQLESTIHGLQAQVPSLKPHYTEIASTRHLPQPRWTIVRLRSLLQAEECVAFIVRGIYNLPLKPRTMMHQLLWKYLKWTKFLSRIAQRYALSIDEITPAVYMMLNRVARKKARIDYLKQAIGGTHE